MDSAIEKQSKTISALIHISTFSKYVIPFGNFIIPLILWQANTKDEYVNKHGKEALNFQISILLYSILIVLLSIPFIIYYFANTIDLDFHFHITDENISDNINQLVGLGIFGIIAGLLIITLFIAEIVCVILATSRASDGEEYSYPLTIRLIK